VRKEAGMEFKIEDAESLGGKFLRNVWFLQGPHGVASQMTAFFIVTAVKTSNLTRDIV
jgi:hypothetical protein